MRGKPAPGRWNRGGLVAGAILIAVGTILLLDQAGILRVREVVRFWPALLIALGVWIVIRGRR